MKVFVGTVLNHGGGLHLVHPLDCHASDVCQQFQALTLCAWTTLVDGLDGPSACVEEHWVDQNFRELNGRCLLTILTQQKSNLRGTKPSS